MAEAGWHFFTNHAHVLFCIARDPDARMREVASMVGITERATQRIITELTAGGYLRVERIGRRNHYRVDGHLPLRHPIEAHRTVADLLTALGPRSP